MTNRDPQGLALPPSSDPKVELMDWLASPDGGALRMDQAIHVAREIAHGRVPHVAIAHEPVCFTEWLRAIVMDKDGDLCALEADYLDMSYITTALVSAGWSVRLLQRAE